ncbi:MAG: hypothetical protein WD825_03170 [Gemmatimonadaceae bacterium]
MAMNTQKVLVGGLAAGVVLNVIDFITNTYILGDRMAAEMNAVAPGLADKMMTGGMIATYVIMDFVIGILLVWLYAAIRPRFGPGPKTAVYGGLFVWVVFGLAYLGYLFSGMMSGATWVMASVIALINVLLASWLGARIYTEEGAASVM